MPTNLWNAHKRLSYASTSFLFAAEVILPKIKQQMQAKGFQIKAHISIHVYNEWFKKCNQNFITKGDP